MSPSTDSPVSEIGIDKLLDEVCEHRLAPDEVAVVEIFAKKMASDPEHTAGILALMLQNDASNMGTAAADADTESLDSFLITLIDHALQLWAVGNRHAALMDADEEAAVAPD